MTCPANPAPPVGYTLWRGQAVPQVLINWALRLRDREMRGAPFGATWPYVYEGQTVLARKDHHHWVYRPGGVATGLCIPGITLYQQTSASAPIASAAGGVDPLAIAPDPTAALFPDDRGVDWGLVFATGAAAIATVGAFWLAMRLAGAR